MTFSLRLTDRKHSRLQGAGEFPRIVSRFQMGSKCVGLLLAATSFGPLALAQTITPQAASSAALSSKLQYVQVGPQGAQAKNLADQGAVTMQELAVGALLAVHSERAGWLDAETPGGFKVWVWGAYVEPSLEAGMLSITGNDVHMRPLPSNGTDSYYLRQSLGKGLKVRYVKRHDPSKSLDQDWVQVYSPPGARAWIAKSQTVTLEGGAVGTALWAKAIKDQSASPVAAVSGAKDLATPQPATAQVGNTKQAAAALRAADELLAKERKKHEQRLAPNYAAVKAAYEQVLVHSSAGSAAESATAKLALVDELGKAYQTEIDLEAERARRVAELSQRESAMEKARNRDSLEGRFDARGWLEKRTVPGEVAPVYVLQFAGASVCEIVCFSGRYDLEVFVGHELGVFGGKLRGALDGSLNEPSRPAQLDIKKIEVLAARLPK